MHEPRQADKPPKKWLFSESGDFYVNGKKVLNDDVMKILSVDYVERLA